MKRNLYMAKTFNNYIGTKLITAIPAEKHTCTTEACPENIPGYKVIYEDGYTSWSPKDTFEKAYMPTNGISLGLAIDAMKLGLSVRLPYWSEDVFLSLQKPTDLSKMTAPYIYVTSRFGLVPWAATQVELLSTEWEIIND